MSKELLDDSFRLGAKTAAAQYGIEWDDVIFGTGFRETLTSDEDYKRGVCKIASALFAGERDSKGSQVMSQFYSDLSEAPKWYPTFDTYVTAVTDSMSKCASALDYELELDENEDLRKVASPAAAMTAISGAKSLASKAPGLAVLMSLLGGGAVGGAAFLANRSAKESDANNAILRERIRNYNRMKGEIIADLARSGALETEGLDDDREVVDEYLSNERLA